MIDAKPFCTDCTGKEYSIKEADNSAQNSGEGQKECSGDKCAVSNTGLFQADSSMPMVDLR